jgi:tRNA(adenine34) deaminase
VVVCQNTIIAKAHNQTELLQDVTAHAEMLALTAAANTLGAKYLRDCTLYVTLEPCIMCGGALYWSQIGKIVIGVWTIKGCSKVSPKFITPKHKLSLAYWKRLVKLC